MRTTFGDRCDELRWERRRSARNRVLTGESLPVSRREVRAVGETDSTPGVGEPRAAVASGSTLFRQ